MTSPLIPVNPTKAAELLKSGAARLIDIREADEFARRHVKGALSMPLSTFDVALLQIAPSMKTIFTCRTGMRTAANCDRLGAAVPGETYVLEGGLDGWAAAGLPVKENRNAPLEILRQVQLTAGALVLIGIGLGFAIHPAFFALSAFVGAGLTFAGATGFCGVATLLARMPWNRGQAI